MALDEVLQPLLDGLTPCSRDGTLSGAPHEQVAAVPQDVVFSLFGRDLSMGKGQGLIGMLELVPHEARRRLDARRRKAAGLA